MKLIRGLYNIPKITKSIVTIGNFDGIHLGHQTLIKQNIKEAKEKNLVSIVMSFQKTAYDFFNQKQAVLTNFREKYQLLKDLGVDYFVIINFNEKFANTTASDFVHHILLKQLKMHKIIIGDDFKFGKNRQGDILYLQQLSLQNKFIVTTNHSIKHQQQRISSSAIRVLLEQGDFMTAKNYLGRDYSISGKIIQGEKLGRTIGFPTLNIALKRKTNPLFGIFIVTVKIDKITHQGVASIGHNPTVNGKKMLLEVFLFNFNQDVYFKNVVVVFIKKIRDEQKFNTLIELQDAIKNDCQIAQRHFEQPK